MAVSKLMKTSLGRDKLYLNKYMMQGKEENYAQYGSRACMTPSVVDVESSAASSQCYF